MVQNQKEGMLTYFFKNGVIKAQGMLHDGAMEGEWNYYRETGQLWQIGHFKGNQKHGTWVQYNLDGEQVYKADFENGREL